MEREVLKFNAKQQIKGKIGTLFVISLIVGLITGAASAIPSVGSVVNAFFLSPAFSIALVMIYLNVANGIDVQIGDVFNGFSYFWGAFKVSFFTTLFTFLWSLLLIVPGIIKSFSYAMAMYIWSENKEMGALEAINKSKKMMDGHKMDYFVLGLSFIGWILLGCITLGIALIYVIPYMETTMANFYNSIKDSEPVQIETPVEA